MAAKFFKVLDDIAPLEFSHKLIEKGSYDNSGILIKTHDYVNGAIFSLDLSDAVLKKAKALGVRIMDEEEFLNVIAQG